ncbi:hypothetical protein MMAN_06490 [Mycobacterium mantenii]|nr:hypothetical protein MMAN_06490 [Mycobacterium mantenii]
MAAQCMVAGCESSALTIHNLTPNREWASLPGEILVCNLHKEELEKPGAEWLLERDEDKIYVGDSLRNLNEYILVGIDSIKGYGAGREFSHNDENGHHIHMRVRRRGEPEKEIALVITSHEMAKVLKDWAKLLPPVDD